MRRKGKKKVRSSEVGSTRCRGGKKKKKDLRTFNKNRENCIQE